MGYPGGVLRHRTKKQIIVAIVFFGFWGGLGTLVVWAVKPEPAPPTPTPRPVIALEAKGAVILRLPNGRADIVGRILNKNASAGSEDVRYAFVLRLGSDVVRAIPGRSSILPGREKVVVALDQDIAPEIQTAELTVEQPRWAFVSPDFTPPSIVLVDQTRRELPGSSPVFEVKGLLANQSDLDYTRVEVVTLGRDAGGEVVGVSQSFVGSLLARERREFTAQWPSRPNRPVVNIDVLSDVNVFRADAVQQRQGDLQLRDIPRPHGSPSR